MKKVLTIALVVACAVAVLRHSNFRTPQPTSSSSGIATNNDSDNAESGNQKKKLNRQKTKIVGVVKKHKEIQAKLQRLDPDVKLDDTYRNEQALIEANGYGTFPVVDMTKMNSHIAHVQTALKDPVNNSGVISIVGKREKFDPAKYSENPSYYIDTVEAGRAFDAAAPADGVKSIERVGYQSIQAKQNETVDLTAIGEAGQPLSFTAFDGGHFQNGLSFITLQADASGSATAEFTPTDGVINQTRIRAASPVNTGTLQWTVFVHLNNNTDK